MKGIDRAYADGDLAGWQMGGNLYDLQQRGYWYNARSGVFHRGGEPKLVAVTRDMCGLILGRLKAKIK